MCGKLGQHHQRAFTITEVWLAIAVSSLVLAGLMSFTIYASKSFAGMTNYVDLEQKSQNALDTLTRDVRQVKFLASYGTTFHNGRMITNRLVFKDSDNQDLTFIFTNGVLVRAKAGNSTMLLTNCDYLSFQIFQRNPVGGTYDQYPTAIATNCKLISVSWVCSRTILGSRMNTESVQTAKVIIRNDKSNL